MHSALLVSFERIVRDVSSWLANAGLADPEGQTTRVKHGSNSVSSRVSLLGVGVAGARH